MTAAIHLCEDRNFILLGSEDDRNIIFTICEGRLRDTHFEKIH